MPLTNYNRYSDFPLVLCLFLLFSFGSLFISFIFLSKGRGGVGGGGGAEKREGTHE